MSLYIIDASVAVKWSVPARGENLVDQALGLLARYRDSEVRFAVPDLFWAEFGNIMWKAVRLGRCTTGTAETAIDEIRDLRLPTFSSDSLIERAFSIATTFDRTMYDSIYVALAVESRAQLVTADEKLANALAATFPVKWLKAL